MAKTKHKDLAPLRHGQLLSLLRQEGVVRLDTLCERLEVSPATIRRDLEELETRGLLRRVHGGAVPVNKLLEEPLFDEKADQFQKEKSRIAQAALEFIEPGETVYLDGGSTVLALARLLKNRDDITVVTNSLRAAMELGGGGPRLLLTGGQLRRTSQTLVGTLTAPVLQELNLDRAFIGTIGITLKQGMTTTDIDEAFTKKLAIAAAREVTLLADSGKFGKVSFVNAGEISDLRRIITDSGLCDDVARGFDKTGLTLLRVSAE